MVVCAAGALLAGSGDARADDASAFELGKNAFDRADYEGAARRFGVLLDPAAPPCTAAQGNCRLTDPEFIERARALYAASLIAQKRVAEAEAQILAIYLQNPGYTPNPAVFPPEVIDKFTDVEGKNRDKIAEAARRRDEAARLKRIKEKEAQGREAARIALLEQLAGQETVVEPRSRAIALVPFGVGQFQNGDVPLGVGFAISQVVLGGASIVSAVVANEIASTNPFEVQGRDLAAFRDKRDDWVLANRVLFGAWLASTVAGIVQAQIAFMPERTTTRPRPIPKPKRLTPTASVGAGTAIVGLTGTF